MSSCLRFNWHPINATTDSSRVSDFSVGLSKHWREGKNQLVNPAWLLWTAASVRVCFAYLVQRALTRVGTAKWDNNLRSKSGMCQQRGSTLKQRSVPWLPLSIVQHPKSLGVWARVVVGFKQVCWSWQQLCSNTWRDHTFFRQPMSGQKFQIRNLPHVIVLIVFL